MNISEILGSATAQLVDVRTTMEYDSGHARGAVNIPLDQFATRYREITELGTKPVVFYCRSGNRSAQAVAYLRQLGIENIYNGGGLGDIQRYVH